MSDQGRERASSCCCEPSRLPTTWAPKRCRSGRASRRLPCDAGGAAGGGLSGTRRRADHRTGGGGAARRRPGLSACAWTPATSPRLLPSMPRLSALAREGFQACLGTVLSAVTCSVQATLLTGLAPSGHGVVGNGWYFRELGEPLLWRQSNALVCGEKVWETARDAMPCPRARGPAGRANPPARPLPALPVLGSRRGHRLLRIHAAGHPHPRGIRGATRAARPAPR